MHASFARVVVLAAAGGAAASRGLAAGNPPGAPAPPAQARSGAVCECLPRPVLPVSLYAMLANDGWSLTFRLPPFQAVTGVFVRFDDHPEESTGHEHVLDVMTGKPEARTWILLPADWVTPGDHIVAVRIAHLDGTIGGPYKLHFDPRAESLAAAKSAIETGGDSTISFAEHSEEVTWLFLSSLFDMADSLREIRFSVDDCSLRERIVLGGAAPPPPPGAEPGSRAALSAELPYLTLPRTTRSACAQVDFRDGTVSKVMSIRRRPDAAPRPDR